MTKKRPNNEKQQIYVNLDTETLDNVQYLAGFQGLSRNNYLEKVISNHIDNNKELLTQIKKLHKKHDIKM